MDLFPEDGCVRVTYAYDRANQLTAERCNGTNPYSHNYDHDTFGNRLVKSADTQLTTTTYDAANQIRSSLSGSGRITYTYDATGDPQVVREPGGDRTTYVWGYENQNTLVRRPAGSPATMTFNADLLRVSKED